MITRSTSLVIVTTVFLFFALFAVHHALALSPSDIVFPVVELNNCTDKEACMEYCDQPSNQTQCEEFALKYNLNHRNERNNEIRKSGGPGDCARNSENPEESCRNFCGREENITTCVDWAEKNGFLKDKELEEAKKVRDAIKRGAKLPPSCKNMDSCEKICKTPRTLEDAKACFRFAKEAGFAPNDLTEERIEKMFAVLQSGEGSFKSFDDFSKCENPENDEILKQCIDFAIENNLISSEEAEILKKTNGKGPGGCQGRECQNFCNNEANVEVCQKFAEEHGLIRPEDKARMEEGRAQFRQNLERIPEEVKACLSSIIGEEDLKKLTSGEKMPSQSIGRQMQQCFGHQNGNGNDTNRPEFGGDMERGENGERNRPPHNGRNEMPCKSPEECKIFFEQKLHEKRENVNEMQEEIQERERRMHRERYQMQGEITPEMRERMMEQYNQNPDMRYSDMPSAGEMPPPVQDFSQPTSKDNSSFFQNLIANIFSIFLVSR